MIVHRFMSAEEYRRLVNGQLLVNESKHKGFRSESRGFCFTTDEPKEAIHYLSGNVDTDYCVTMDIPESMLHKSKALYRDWQNDDVMSYTSLPTNANDVPTVEKTEYCLTRYSVAKVRIIATTTEFNHIPGIKMTQQLMQVLGYRRAK